MKAETHTLNFYKYLLLMILVYKLIYIGYF
jgi:hypothetical protein